MTKTEMEARIIDGLRNAPSPEKYGGEYKYYQWLPNVISKVMGYRIIHDWFGNRFDTIEEKRNVEEIIRRMEANGIIKMSKSGKMFRLTV